MSGSDTDLEVLEEDQDRPPADDTGPVHVDPTAAELPGTYGIDHDEPWTERTMAWVVEHWIASLLGVLALVTVGSLVQAGEVQMGGVLVDGARSGALYAIVAVGIALVYRTTRVINFAQGEFGTLPAFFALLLLTGFDLQASVDPGGVSVTTMAGVTFAAILVGAGFAILVNIVIIQRLSEANPVTSLVATAGVFLLSIGAQAVIFGIQVRRFPTVVPGSVCLIRGDAGACSLQTDYHNLVTIALLIVVAALLALLFRTPLGTALLATAQDPFAASLHGLSPRATSALAWGLAGGLAGLAGVLGAGFFEQMTPGFMTTTFLLPAFTAAVLGGMTSVTGAMIGGLLVGAAAALANGVTSGFGLTSVIQSPPDVAIFSMLLIVLLVRPQGLFGKAA